MKVRELPSYSVSDCCGDPVSPQLFAREPSGIWKEQKHL